MPADRTDTATRHVAAPPGRVYRAILDADSIVRWLPPQGMSGRVERFDPRPDGSFRMCLTYDDPMSAGQGKTTEDTDVVEGRFVSLVPDEQVSMAVIFQADDPAFAGEMVLTFDLAAVADGTDVTIICTDVPHGIAKADHEEALASTLDNLARFLA